MSLRAEWDRLLVAARGGDALALGQLLEVAQDDLQSVASGVLGRSTQARLPVEDVLAEALVAVVKDIASLRATNYVGFRFWFASIARNNVRRTLRRERGRAEVTADDDPEGEDATRRQRALASESLAFVRHVLVCMPRTQQVAYVLREGLGLSWLTIGFVLERRAAAAARLVHYRAALRVKHVAGTRPDLRLAVPVLLT
jgi:RNA polymerase sigma factor (sigma-70 family)